MTTSVLGKTASNPKSWRKGFARKGHGDSQRLSRLLGMHHKCRVSPHRADRHQQATLKWSRRTKKGHLLPLSPSSHDSPVFEVRKASWSYFSYFGQLFQIKVESSDGAWSLGRDRSFSSTWTPGVFVGEGEDSSVFLMSWLDLLCRKNTNRADRQINESNKVPSADFG